MLSDPFFPDGLPALPAEAAASPAASNMPAGLPAPRPTGTGFPASRRVAASLPDTMTLLRAAGNRWLLALSLGVSAGVAAGALAWKVVPQPRYTAEAVLEIKAEKPNLLPGMGQGRTDLRTFQATQLALVHSRLVVQATLAKPGIRDLATVRALADPAEWLADSLAAEFPAGSELMSLTLAGDNPADIVALLNAAAEAYLAEVVTKDHDEQLATSEQLKEMLAHYNEDLAKERAELKAKAETVGSDDRQTLALKHQMAMQQLADERRELQTVRNELKQAEAELQVRHDAGDAGPEAIEAAEEVEAAIDREPEIQILREEAAALTKKLGRARRLTRNPGDPSVSEPLRALNLLWRDEAAARAALRPKIERELRARNPGVETPARRIAELETRIKSLSGYEPRLTEEIARLEAEVNTFNRNTIDLQWLKERIEHGEEIARQLGRQIEALNVELRAPQRGRLIERAESPRLESNKKRLATVGLAAFGSFGLAVVGVAWREYRLRRVGSPEEVTDGLGLRLVGTLPALPGARGMARQRRDVPSGPSGLSGGGDGWHARLIESIDAARTVLLRDCRNEALRTILITSATKGEGKSSLSGHLAISLARTGRRTLLADFDLRSPSLHRLFDLDRGPGVGELLRGEAELDDVYHAVADDLDVITAGHGDATAIRALGQDALPDLLARMAGRYEFVVIDSAPLLPVADSLLISQHTDAVLLSVYREVSRLPTVHAACERLAALGVRVLGAVVTGMPPAHFGAAYHDAGARPA